MLRSCGPPRRAGRGPCPLGRLVPSSRRRRRRSGRRTRGCPPPSPERLLVVRGNDDRDGLPVEHGPRRGAPAAHERIPEQREGDPDEQADEGADEHARPPARRLRPHRHRLCGHAARLDVLCQRQGARRVEAVDLQRGQALLGERDLRVEVRERDELLDRAQAVVGDDLCLRCTGSGEARLHDPDLCVDVRELLVERTNLRVRVRTRPRRRPVFARWFAAAAVFARAEPVT